MSGGAAVGPLSEQPGRTVIVAPACFSPLVLSSGDLPPGGACVEDELFLGVDMLRRTSNGALMPAQSSLSRPVCGRRQATLVRLRPQRALSMPPSIAKGD